MKRIIIGIFFLFSFLLPFQQVYAIDFCPFGQFTQLCNLAPNDNTNLVGNIFTLLLIAAVIAAIGFLIWGGLRWILAGGDKGKIDSARGTITGAIIGLIIAFLAFGIVAFVNYVFGINSPNGTVFQLPHIYSNPNTGRPDSGGSSMNHSLPACAVMCANPGNQQQEDECIQQNKAANLCL